MRKITKIALRLPIVRLALLTMVVVLAPVDLTLAQSWRFEPAVRAGFEYDDNSTLNVRTDEEVELRGYLIDMSVTARYASPATSFFVQPRFLFRNYPDEGDFNSEDIFIRSNYTHTGTTNTYGFRINFDSQAIRTAERTDSDLDIEDPEDIPDNESARSFRFGTRDNWRIAPFWRYQISDTSSFGVDASYVDASYDDQLVEVLNDYTDARVNLGYRKTISPAATLVFKATVRRYESSDALSEIDGYGLTGGFERALSEKMRLSATIGLERTNTLISDTDPEVVGDVTLSRNLKTIRLFVQYKRSITASGIKSLSIRESISLNFRRRLSDKISAGLGARIYKSRGFADASTVDDRNYIQLQAAFAWYLGPTFTMEVDYRYSILDRQDVFSESSNSNRINLWFTWQPNTIPLL